MLSVRNAIFAAAILLVVAVLTSLIGMLQTPDSGGLGHDSYGTRGRGYRGVFEVLDELGIRSTRELAPPDPSTLTDETLVLLGPDRRIVGFEPTYLHGLQPWVRQGGRVVVSPRYGDDALQPKQAQLDEPPPTVLEALGLDWTQLIYSGTNPEPRRRFRSERNRSAEEIAQEIIDDISGPLPELTVVPVKVEGELQSSLNGVSQLMIPEESIKTLAIDDDQEPAEGRVVWVDEDGEEQTLVARFSRGSGEIVVISDPELLANRLLAEADNSVLAVQLLSPAGEAVRFDEFYHGLGVRGSPLFLLTRLPYATVALGLLLLLALGIWRRAVFLGPPLPDVETSRRDISEYIAAMGRFFAIGRQGRGRLVQQVRDGVLRQISDELGMPPETGNVDRIAAAIARRDVRRGEMVIETTRAVDFELRTRRHWSESQTLDAMQRMTDCLSKNATRPSEPNWKKLSSARTT